MKILLVEDEELLADAIAKGLTKLGFAVDQAYDGDVALYSYEVHTYSPVKLGTNKNSTFFYQSCRI